jgi:hypothetical protein
MVCNLLVQAVKITRFNPEDRKQLSTWQATGESQIHHAAEAGDKRNTLALRRTRLIHKTTESQPANAKTAAGSLAEKNDKPGCSLLAAFMILSAT